MNGMEKIPGVKTDEEVREMDARTIEYIGRMATETDFPIDVVGLGGAGPPGSTTPASKQRLDGLLSELTPDTDFI